MMTSQYTHAYLIGYSDILVIVIVWSENTHYDYIQHLLYTVYVLVRQGNPLLEELRLIN